MVKKLIAAWLCVMMAISAFAENGYDLWLRYIPVKQGDLRKSYTNWCSRVVITESSATMDAILHELSIGWKGMLGLGLTISKTIPVAGNALLIGTSTAGPVKGLPIAQEAVALNAEGYLIKTVSIKGRPCLVVTAKTQKGLLYGVFALLQLMQTGQSLQGLNISRSPKLQLRVLNHWDNLNGTVERGYAGGSIWDWQRLPGFIDPRYIDYARANASVGINGTVLNNVNAKAVSLTKEYILKAAALAGVFRPYGIKVYLTARFSAPKEIGGLKTADPLDPEVRAWWKKKADEIYQYIPDFGGFLVKANSEGQPGPGDYRRTHADGANMIAEALKPHGGIVMWRAFVYENRKGEDRATQAYREFKPLDGKFATNVLLQPKYGPIDFQPREALHPIFGSMPQTQLMMEFQLTQEYFGFASHLVYLGTLFKEYLQTDTWSGGKGSTVSSVISDDNGGRLTGMAGVANIGTDINWCGHPFAASNWFAFGKFAWDPEASPFDVAMDWVKMTFSSSGFFNTAITKLMMDSREMAVNYMTPLGLNHIMNFATHYGPGPWYKDPHWDAWDYHHADSVGLGVDRTATGSNAVAQYAPALAALYANRETVPKELLLWFHHVEWDAKMASGKTMWEELVLHYYNGVEKVRSLQLNWERMKDHIDAERFGVVKQLIAQQLKEAEWWRDGCVLYFQGFSKRPLPEGCRQPDKPLQYYKRIPFPGF